MVFVCQVDSGYLEHVFSLLERAGYTRVSLQSEWDLLWAHDYPFKVMNDQLKNLKKHQKVSHINIHVEPI